MSFHGSCDGPEAMQLPVVIVVRVASTLVGPVLLLPVGQQVLVLRSAQHRLRLLITSELSQEAFGHRSTHHGCG